MAPPESGRRAGAILEAVFPAVADMEGEEVKAFLIALSRLPGAAGAAPICGSGHSGLALAPLDDLDGTMKNCRKKAQNARDKG